jgi:hypothetical protein
MHPSINGQRADDKHANRRRSHIDHQANGHVEAQSLQQRRDINRDCANGLLLLIALIRSR